MNRSRIIEISIIVSLSLAALLLLCGVANAQSDQVKGLIVGRSGATMTLQTPNSERIVVLLTLDTQVEDSEGVFGFRKKQLGLTALIPGLPVQVKGSRNAQNQLVAQDVKFKASDLKIAQDTQAGLVPTKQQVQANQKQIQAQQRALAQQEQKIQTQQQESAAEAAAIAKNKAAIAAANKRFGELADYNIMGEVTVYFANGSVAIEQKYKPELLKLAQQAKGVDAYIIQVQGYASAVGSAALNQKLSQERADNVLSFLEQDGQIPLTNVLAPGAMGTSDQVAPDATVEGQAQNRRVVVRILQNKGIAGT
jgi:outer membrane protein OmpA-like peptidoglycan-associated protein